jgi:hypothetical protein
LPTEAFTALSDTSRLTQIDLQPQIRKLIDGFSANMSGYGDDLSR